MMKPAPQDKLFPDDYQIAHPVSKGRLPKRFRMARGLEFDTVKRKGRMALALGKYLSKETPETLDAFLDEMDTIIVPNSLNRAGEEIKKSKPQSFPKQCELRIRFNWAFNRKPPTDKEIETAFEGPKLLHIKDKDLPDGTISFLNLSDAAKRFGPEQVINDIKKHLKTTLCWFYPVSQIKIEEIVK